ncbi:MAG: hypothetical protein WA624_17295 [Methylocella sp.]
MRTRGRAKVRKTPGAQEPESQPRTEALTLRKPEGPSRRAAAAAVLDVREFVPAPGQGAIAITVRSGDDATRALLAPVLDAATGVALATERAFLRVLDGSCKTPIGAFAWVETDSIAFRAIVLKPDGSRFFETAASGPLAEAASLGEAAGHELAARIPAGFFDA